MSNKTILIIGLLLTAGVVAFLFWPGNSSDRLLSDKTEVVMYKNPGCECCTEWAKHIEEGEFAVREEPTPAMMQIKYENGISRELASCHTAFVEGYVVEGHVPIADVRRMLEEKPEAIGLTVPGMPIGSPGMEMPGRPADNYDVLLIHTNGDTSVYSSY